MSTIIEHLQSLKKYLDERLEGDINSLRYKSTIEPDMFSTQKPEIYLFTMPSSGLVDGYPSKCPCMCITLDGREGENQYAIGVHLCVSNGSTSEAEKAIRVGENKYQFNSDNRDYTTDADEDLVVESILFTNQIYNYIRNYTQVNVTDLSLEYPDVSLPDFPYAISNLTFKIQIDDRPNNLNVLY